MIKVEHLIKIFKSKKSEKVVALDNLSFNLPDTGLVFVTGKSGSGKTTLLSLIGGLDKFDSGEIIVNGISLSSLKGVNFDYYRNETIGFIFQDFQLFDELTVEENIKLALDFKNDKDEEIIRKTLKDVDLENYEKRYPRELSGGEKQRVAIARVLVKNSSIILADEPTGNLDSDTTETILNILKKISKNRLVLIVSHNIFEAHKYADYILELQEGKLLGTYKRNENIEPSISLDDGILRLPLHKEILDAEKENIIKNSKYKIKDIIQDDRDFSLFSLENPAKLEQKPLKREHISFKNAFKRGINFLKKALVPMFVFSLITSSLFALINSSYAIKNISEEEVYNYSLNDYKNDYYYFADECGDINSNANHLFSKNDEVFNKLNDANYDGKIFKSYRSNFTNTSRYTSYLGRRPSNILQVDKEYVESRFGDIEFVAKAEKEEDFGFYCFDYFIDYKNAMNNNNKRDYDSFLGFKYEPGKVAYLNGIIKTDYKTKYAKYLDIILNPDTYLDNQSVMLRSKDKEIYDDYVKDSRYYLNNLITFNEDFINDYVDHPFNLITNKSSKIYLDDGAEEYVGKISYDQTSSYNSIGHGLYEKITGKTLNMGNKKVITIDPINVNIKIFNDVKHEYNIKEYSYVFDHVTSNGYSVSLNVMKPDERNFFRDNTFYLDGFILDSSADINELKNKGCFDDNYYLQNNINVVFNISTKLTNVFSKIFSIVILGLLICCVISSAFYGIYVVKTNMRNIGICKSLGARTFDILIILALNLFIAIVVTILCYCGIAELFMLIIEAILHRAFEKSSFFLFPGSYKLLFNNPIMYILNIVLIAIVSIFSFIALFIKINSLKPIELIKSKK